MAVSGPATNKVETMPGSSRNLSDMSTAELQEFLNSFDVVLSDCDGVLWTISTLIPGAVQALNRLQDEGKRVYLVSNNSLASFDGYKNKMRNGGMDLKQEQLINPSKVIAWYLKKINFREKAFVIGCKAFREVLAAEGIDMLPESFPTANEDDVDGMIESVLDVGSTKAVIVDFSLTDGWIKLVYAITCLAKEDVLFLAGAMDTWLPCRNNEKVLGCRLLTDLISQHSGKTPIMCAKPSTVLRDCVREICNISDPKRCLFIGDSISTDMTFATQCGYQKLFVETGLDKIEDAIRNVEIRPDYYATSLQSLFNGINQLRNGPASNKSSQ